MSSVYLLKFKQIPHIRLAAHWGIFLPYEYSPFDADGNPIIGDLFQASKVCGGCSQRNSNTTLWERQPHFDLPSCPNLIDVLRLDNTDNVSDTILVDACNHVSQDRKFNVISKNCQHWVREVLARLIEQNYINNDVYEQMKLHGFKTAAEAVMTSSSGSLTFWN